MRLPHRLRLSLVVVALCGGVAAMVLAGMPRVSGPLPTAWAASDPAAEELEQNRQLLAKWRQDPAHYARLCADLRLFLALSPEQQDRLRQLDRELSEEDSVTSARLLRVLERSAAWFEHLPPADREQLEAAPDSAERLRRIKELREREWLDRLPRALQEEVHKLAPDQRPARIAELRQEERRRRDEWQVALRHWDELLQKRPQPARLEDFPPDVRSFVQEALWPMLNTEERDRLRQAEGLWPLYPRTLVELSDRHPILLPGPSTGPVRFQDLPADVQERLPMLKNASPAFVRQAEGKWPQYALAVIELARRRKIMLPQPLGPCRAQEFSPMIREFLTKKLMPVLEQEDKNRLKRAEGQWPRYPQVLLDLARKHYLQVPGMGLPEPREFWDKFRTQAATGDEAPPDVPDRTLREFAHTELSAEERANLTTFSDPVVREKLKQEYIKRHPKEWQKLLQLDQQKRQRKAKHLN